MPRRKKQRYPNLGALLEEQRNSKFSRPVTPKRAKKEARARAKVIYKPEIRGISKDIKSSKQRTGQTRDWYQGLRSTLTDTASKTAAGFQSPNADPTTATMLSKQGASQADFYNKLAAISKIQQRKEVLNQKGERGQMKLDKRALKRERGAYVTGEQSKAREADRNYFLGLQAAQQPGQARRFERQQARANRNFQRKDREDQQKFEKGRDRFSAKNFGKSDAKGPKAKPSVSPAAIRGYVSSDNFTPDMSKGDVVRKVLNRWPDLDPSYVRKLISKWAKKKQPKSAGESLIDPKDLVPNFVKPKK